MAKPSVVPFAPCEGLLADQDVEKICGLSSGSVSGRLDSKRTCLRRFKQPGDANSLTLEVVPEDDAERAMKLFNAATRKVKTQSMFAKVAGIGDSAQSFTKTKGNGKKLRAVQALDLASGRFFVKLRELHPPDSKAMCDGAKLPELAKLVVTRLGGGGAAAPAATPAAATPAPTKPAPKPVAEAKPPAPAAKAAPAPKEKPAAKPKPTVP